MINTNNYFNTVGLRDNIINMMLYILRSRINYRSKQTIHDLLGALPSINKILAIKGGNNDSDIQMYGYDFEERYFSIEIDPTTYILSIVYIINDNKIGILLQANLYQYLDETVINTLTNLFSKKKLKTYDSKYLYTVYKNDKEIRDVINNWFENVLIKLKSYIRDVYSSGSKDNIFLIQSIYNDISIVLYNDSYFNKPEVINKLKVLMNNIYFGFLKQITAGFINRNLVLVPEKVRENKIKELGLNLETFNTGDDSSYKIARIRKIINGKINTNNENVELYLSIVELINDLKLDKSSLLYDLVNDKIDFLFYLYHVLHSKKYNKFNIVIDDSCLVLEDGKTECLHRFILSEIIQNKIWRKLVNIKYAIISYSDNYNEDGSPKIYDINYSLDEEDKKYKLACTCPDYIYRSKKKGFCKHIHLLQNSFYYYKTITRKVDEK